MIETCLNCQHFHSLMEDNVDYYFHIHNYCSVWNHVVPSRTMFDRTGLESGFDDVECGYTKCHAFEPKDEQFNMGDDYFIKNREYNECLKQDYVPQKESL